MCDFLRSLCRLCAERRFDGWPRLTQRYALESGVTTINGKIAKPDTIVRNGDRIENIVHRHEPPVTSRPVKILHEDRETNSS
jgi:23S rRNA-/tRNA-specific pseudouridylate synthase